MTDEGVVKSACHSRPKRSEGEGNPLTLSTMDPLPSPSAWPERLAHKVVRVFPSPLWGGVAAQAARVGVPALNWTSVVLTPHLQLLPTGNLRRRKTGLGQAWDLLGRRATRALRARL